MYTARFELAHSIRYKTIQHTITQQMNRVKNGVNAFAFVPADQFNETLLFPLQKIALKNYAHFLIECIFCFAYNCCYFLLYHVVIAVVVVVVGSF